MAMLLSVTENSEKGKQKARVSGERRAPRSAHGRGGGGCHRRQAVRSPPAPFMWEHVFAAEMQLIRATGKSSPLSNSHFGQPLPPIKISPWECCRAGSCFTVIPLFPFVLGRKPVVEDHPGGSDPVAKNGLHFKARAIPTKYHSWVFNPDVVLLFKKPEDLFMVQWNTKSIKRGIVLLQEPCNFLETWRLGCSIPAQNCSFEDPDLEFHTGFGSLRE
ncbi:uncharacterized protein LOC132392188 [Hypanus sabinus]|uniref:uncharacterized protein LOC132392188 n=1 Tax=Hypanus sabinus TaxID=79690 RepID=UPI0028C39DC0|nr:uncharacterized protein LOC132392188 [Hypanus sabinus]